MPAGQCTTAFKTMALAKRELSFHIAEKHSKFHLDELRLAGARFTIDGEETGEQWQLRVTALAVSYPLVQQWLPAGLLKLQGGSLGFRLRAAGSAEAVHDFTVSAELDNVSGQSEDGRFAAEKVRLETQLDARTIAGCGNGKVIRHLKRVRYMSSRCICRRAHKRLCWMPRVTGTRPASGSKSALLITYIRACRVERQCVDSNRKRAEH